MSKSHTVVFFFQLSIYCTKKNWNCKSPYGNSTRSTAVPQPSFCYLKQGRCIMGRVQRQQIYFSLFFLHLTVSHFSSFTKMTNFLCFHCVASEFSTNPAQVLEHVQCISLFGFFTCSTIIVWLFLGQRMDLATIKGN